jgi:hypothetical protein
VTAHTVATVQVTLAGLKVAALAGCLCVAVRISRLLKRTKATCTQGVLAFTSGEPSPLAMSTGVREMSR